MLEKYALMKIMQTALENAASSYSVRQLASESGTSVFAAKEHADYLRERNMVSLEKIGNTYQYKANLNNFLTTQWKVTFTLEELSKMKIIERVLSTKKGILSIILYGSAAIGRDDENSDIDILVIADTDSKGKKEISAKATGTKREVNISVYTPSEWKSKANSDKIFYEKVIIDSIALYGNKPVVL